MTKKYTILTTVTIALVAIVGSTAAIIGTNDVLAVDQPPAGDTTITTYNPDMTDWWSNMIEHLDDESSAIWTESGWNDSLYVQIESAGADTYSISLFGIAASGDPITYTITKTGTGYNTYGPGLEDGTMESRVYVTALPSTEGDGYSALDQPIKPSHLILQDRRTGQGALLDSDSHCWLATDSWFQGDVTDDLDGSRMNWRANPDAYDNCLKPLTPEDVDLA